MRHAILIFLFLVTFHGAGAATAPALPPRFSPLLPLPAARLQALAPLLRGHDVALFESSPQGALQQITLLGLYAAPPQVVYDVIAHPERNHDFVRNVTRSEVRPLPDGSFDYTYTFSYRIFTVDGTLRYVFAQPGLVTGPIDMYDPDGNGLSHYRWELLPVGGGTLAVLYGYTDVNHSGGVIQRIISRVPQLEHGLALVSQMSMFLSMKARAEQLAGAAPVSLPPPAAASYDFLLDRGTVVLLRTQDGHPSELSLVERSTARPAQLLSAAGKPADWSRFVPTITHSSSAGEEDGMPRCELEQSLPLLSFRTTYGLRKNGDSIDMLGLSGDLRGGRLRWDVRVDSTGKSQLVLRASQTFERASLILRQLYKLEPLFEYAVNVGLTLIIHRAIRVRAEHTGV